MDFVQARQASELGSFLTRDRKVLIGNGMTTFVWNDFRIEFLYSVRFKRDFQWPVKP